MAKRKRNTNSAPRNVVAEARSGGGAKPRRDAKWFWEHFKSYAGAIAIFLFVTNFLIQAYRIPSGSMVPALLVGDWLFVDKLRYGPHVPFTRYNLPGYAQPRRGDVVVFKSPIQIDQPWDPTPTVVKRIVGMPGDTIHSRAGLVHINGIPQRQGYGAGGPKPPTANVSDPLFQWQHQFEAKGTRLGAPPAQPTLDDWGPLVIPARRYMMMGDNRYESKDARFYGFVPRENIRGRPLFVYYSYNADDSDRPLPFITDIRWGRIGTRIR